MTASARVPGSFRDPEGSVHAAGGRIFRGIAAGAAAEARDFLASELLRRHAGRTIVRTEAVEAQAPLEAGVPAQDVQAHALWVEHEALSFISYPYEWSFALLQSAALLQLDLHMEALRAGWDLKDATPYNIQFRGCRPVFIDTLSFRRYRENSYWEGYRQFCEQYLAPLALQAYGQVPFNAWFRGALEGIDLVSAARLLPARTLLVPALLANIHLHARMIARVSATRAAAPRPAAAGLPLRNYIHLLESLRRFVAGLRPRGASYWADYRNDTSYSSEGARDKEALVDAFVRRHGVRRLLDLGCNTGHYSAAAVAAGALEVIGTDFDSGALDAAVRRAGDGNLPITPLHVDICNPSPAMGWALRERASLAERLRGIDGMICLAVIHHLAIGRNVPLQDCVEALVALAPRGLIEFVPKSDPMAAGLLAHREDIFPDYTLDAFLRLLGERARAAAVHPLRGSDRVLVEYLPA